MPDAVASCCYMHRMQHAFIIVEAMKTFMNEHEHFSQTFTAEVKRFPMVATNAAAVTVTSAAVVVVVVAIVIGCCCYCRCQ